jgi:hypothetical protein
MRAFVLVLLVMSNLSLVAQGPVCFWIVPGGEQKLTAWEVSAYIASPCDPRFGELRDKMLDSLVEYTNTTRLSIEIRSGVENTVDYFARYRAQGCPTGSDPSYLEWIQHRYHPVNDNAGGSTDTSRFFFSEVDFIMDSIALPLERRLAARGRRLELNFVYRTEPDTVDLSSFQDKPVEYAEFVVATYQHLQDKYGRQPDTWEVFYEPERSLQWDAQLIGTLVVYTAGTLRNLGFKPAMIAPSVSSLDKAYIWFTDILKVPKVRDELVALSYHGLKISDDPRYDRDAAFAASFKLPIAMQYIQRENATIRTMMHNLESAWVSIWNQGAIADQFDVDTVGSRVSIKRTRNAVYTSHVTNTVRSGAQRYFVQSGGCRVLAYKNPDGEWVFVRQDYTTPPEATVPYGIYEHTYTDTNLVTLTDTMIVKERQIPKWGFRHRYHVATLRLRTPLTDVPTESTPIDPSLLSVDFLHDGTAAIVNLAQPQHIVLRVSDLLGRSEVVYEGRADGILRMPLHAHVGGIRFLTLQLQENSTLHTLVLPPD